MNDETNNNAYMQGRVVEAIERLTETLRGLGHTQDDHSKRIVSLENWRAYVIGAAAVVVCAIGFLT